MLNSSLNISPISLGTVKFGRNTGVKYTSKFNLPSDEELRQLLSVARGLGINFLDTAPAYGSSEARIGKLVGNDEYWKIGTKAGEVFDGSTSHYDFSPKALLRQIENSRKTLQRDTLDVLLIHSNGDDERIIKEEGALDTLANLKDKGLILSFGMSVKTPQGAMLALESSDIIMIEYNILMPDSELEQWQQVIDKAADKGKSVLVKKALASGKALQQYSLSECVDFILSNKGITSLVLGTLNQQHLKDAAKS